MIVTARIEVATTGGAAKVKGDLLEGLAQRLLGTQSYAVETEVRVTACELDLLCRHKVSGNSLYVECKALRDPLAAPPLRQLLGTVEFKGYHEGWLISAGPLGKDAKGFQTEWEAMPAEKRGKLSIYTPERVIQSLRDAHLLVAPPVASAEALLASGHQLGDWTLLVTDLGEFWAATCLHAGVPSGVLSFEANTGKAVRDLVLLRSLAKTDSSLGAFDFEYAERDRDQHTGQFDHDVCTKIVEVKHGESWDDYRPARPEHFIGRKDAQQKVLRFLDAVRMGESTTRVFAITGDTGMGKSSLVAKLRSRADSPRLKRRLSLYAVDVRAAAGPSYVHGALLTCLRAAATGGFGVAQPAELIVSDHADPLASRSIQTYLESVAKNEQLICLVFDQFEELYSKPELFPVFEEAQRLFLSAAASALPLVVGFVLRSDSTVQQDHPAYYLWHRLSDHRYEVRLRVFSHAEVCAALTLFEKELGQRLRPELRRQVIENCEGYPWLLKKLCIHLYEQISGGVEQAK